VPRLVSSSPSEAGISEPRAALEALLTYPGSALPAALSLWNTARPAGSFSIGPGTRREGSAVFVLWDSAEAGTDRWPYLARLILRGNRWYLESILERCASCFGEGLLPGGDPCGTCLAAGWGVGESSPFPIPALPD
jgi:hypothetical protein